METPHSDFNLMKERKVDNKGDIQKIPKIINMCGEISISNSSTDNNKDQIR